MVTLVFRDFFTSYFDLGRRRLCKISCGRTFALNLFSSHVLPFFSSYGCFSVVHKNTHGWDWDASEELRLSLLISNISGMRDRARCRSGQVRSFRFCSRSPSAGGI